MEVPSTECKCKSLSKNLKSTVNECILYCDVLYFLLNDGIKLKLSLSLFLACKNTTSFFPKDLLISCSMSILASKTTEE